MCILPHVCGHVHTHTHTEVGEVGRRREFGFYTIPQYCQLRSESLELIGSVVLETKCFLLLEEINPWI